MSPEPEEWNTNAFTLRMPVGEMEMFQSFHAEMDRMMRESMRRMVAPWEFPDRNPFPSYAWWPWIDRALWLRTHGRQEARDRLTEAWSVLRHGIPDRNADPRNRT